MAPNGAYNSLPQSTKNSVTAHFGSGAYLIGTNNAVMLMPDTLDSYNSWSEVSAANKAGTTLTENAIFYIPLSTRVTNVELTLEAPLCGTTYETAGSFNGQENAPQVTIPEDAGVQGDTRSAIFAMWAKSTSDRSGFVGTMVGGNTYHAHIWIEAKFGYFLNPRFVTLTINGEEPELYSARDLARWGFFAAVEAEHEWGEWEVTTEPTIDAEGEETRYCEYDSSHFETRPIDKLEAATLTFNLNGGTLEGKTGTVTIVAAVGDTIMIPAAPTRSGYRFKYWRGSEYYPGDQYEVTGDHEFTAEWEEIEPEIEPKPDEPKPDEPKTEPKPKPKPAPKPSAVPRTGEPASLVGMLALLGGAMAAAGRKLRKR